MIIQCKLHFHTIYSGIHKELERLAICIPVFIITKLQIAALASTVRFFCPVTEISHRIAIQRRFKTRNTSTTRENFTVAT